MNILLVPVVILTAGLFFWLVFYPRELKAVILTRDVHSVVFVIYILIVVGALVKIILDTL